MTTIERAREWLKVNRESFTEERFDGRQQYVLLDEARMLTAFIDAECGWVRVEERLPTPNTEVLVRILDNGFPYFDVWKYDDEYPNQYWSGSEDNRVTHWQVITKPETAAKEAVEAARGER